MKWQDWIFWGSIVLLYVCVCFAFNRLIDSRFSSKQIVVYARSNCPQSKDMNNRFELLYKKYGKGKTVPYKFVDGTVVNYDGIYENFDYLLRDK